MANWINIAQLENWADHTSYNETNIESFVFWSMKNVQDEALNVYISTHFKVILCFLLITMTFLLIFSRITVKFPH